MSKVKYSNRKFYNKWLYKVTFNLKGAGIFRDRTPNEVIQFCIEPPNDRIYYGTLKAASGNKENIIKIAMFLDGNPGAVYGKRIETDYFDIYTNDKEFYEDLYTLFPDLTEHAFEPLPGHIEEILNSSNIVTTKLPHNKYNYKVYLLPHKLKNDVEKKQSFIDWVETQESRVRMSAAVKKWFITTTWNWDRRYILVEDEQTLFMMQLRNAEVIGRVYNYQLVDK